MTFSGCLPGQFTRSPVELKDFITKAGGLTTFYTVYLCILQIWCIFNQEHLVCEEATLRIFRAGGLRYGGSMGVEPTKMRI